MMRKIARITGALLLTLVCVALFIGLLIITP